MVLTIQKKVISILGCFITTVKVTIHLFVCLTTISFYWFFYIIFSSNSCYLNSNLFRNCIYRYSYVHVCFTFCPQNLLFYFCEKCFIFLQFHNALHIALSYTNWTILKNDTGTHICDCNIFKNVCWAYLWMWFRCTCIVLDFECTFILQNYRSKEEQEKIDVFLGTKGHPCYWAPCSYSSHHSQEAHGIIILQNKTENTCWSYEGMNLWCLSIRIINSIG